ncbi:hypothetical protein CRG98_042842 [Punica granatum]|uniref:Reverse transcriptase Ty1/copia-type domain-containing protein n=1 Tax=Punica granatum TaxID=22663 RepID=A0A2I0HYI9_PUNGR|nr:hypothetical protein CRG98_042842 [Punica granatum]
MANANSSYPFPSNLNIANFVTIKLNEDNYLLWETQVVSLIESRDLLGFLTGETTAPTETIPGANEGEVAANPDYFAWVWKALTEHFAQHSIAREFDFLSQLQHIEKGDLTLSKYLSNFKSICDQLSAIGKPVSDVNKVFRLLEGLGDKYESFKTTMLRPPIPRHSQQPQQKNHRGSSQGGLHKPGIPTCQICRRRGHTALKCYHRFDNSYQANNIPQALAALQISDAADENWHPDTGANVHVTNDPALFRDSAAAPADHNISKASDSTAAPVAHNISEASSEPHAIQPPLPSTDNLHPMITRAKAGISKPNSKFANLSTLDIPAEPRSVKSALKHHGWKEAMLEELKALRQNHTWELVPRTDQMNVVGCKWVFKTKLRADGTLDSLKARLVAKGFHQEEGIDYLETFSPIVKPGTIRIVLTLAVVRNWSIRQLDFKNAFLHGSLDVPVYMEQPPDFRDDTCPHHVCLLHRALYGLKQAPRAWFERFSDFLLQYGFQCSLADPSLFVFRRDQHILILLLYVDDIIITGDSDSLIHDLTVSLGRVFSMKDLGPLHYFLGVEKMHSPTLADFQRVKRILRYIRGSLSLGLCILSSSSLDLHAFADADWAGCKETRRSTTGFCAFLGANCISWGVKRQPTVARSTAEAEYRALAVAAAELTWISYILRDLGVFQPRPSLLFTDNISALHLTLNPIFHARTKHVEIDYHFVREKVALRSIVTQFVPTTLQVADIFTKPLGSKIDTKLPSSLSDLKSLSYLPRLSESRFYLELIENREIVNSRIES